MELHSNPLEFDPKATSLGQRWGNHRFGTRNANIYLQAGPPGASGDKCCHFNGKPIDLAPEMTTFISKGVP